MGKAEEPLYSCTYGVLTNLLTEKQENELLVELDRNKSIRTNI